MHKLETKRFVNDFYEFNVSQPALVCTNALGHVSVDADGFSQTDANRMNSISVELDQKRIDVYLMASINLCATAIHLTSTIIIDKRKLTERHAQVGLRKII